MFGFFLRISGQEKNVDSACFSVFFLCILVVVVKYPDRERNNSKEKSWWKLNNWKFKRKLQHTFIVLSMQMFHIYILSLSFREVLKRNKFQQRKSSDLKFTIILESMLWADQIYQIKFSVIAILR